MTARTLRLILSHYPDDMEVVVSCDRFTRPVNRVETVVDMDTNSTFVDIQAEDKPDLGEIARRAKESMYAARYDVEGT